MHRIGSLTPAVAAAILAFSPLAVPATANAADWKAAKVVWPRPLLMAGTTKKISDHVFVIPDNNIPGTPNAGIVKGATATLIIDCGMGRQNGEICLNEMKKVAPSNDLFLTATHYHPDHILGAVAFPPETKVVLSKALQEDIRDHGESIVRDFSNLSPVFGDLLKDAPYPKATISFDDDYTIDLGGGVTVHAIAMGANHTHGDTIFVVQPDNVVFSGDVVMRGVLQVNTPDATLAHWLQSLDKIVELAPSVIVPDHGPLGDVALIQGYRSYLTTILKRAAELKHQGKSLDETVEIIRTELSPTFEDGQYAGVWRWGDRMISSVEQAYNEAK